MTFSPKVLYVTIWNHVSASVDPPIGLRPVT